MKSCEIMSGAMHSFPVTRTDFKIEFKFVQGHF